MKCGVVACNDAPNCREHCARFGGGARPPPHPPRIVSAARPRVESPPLVQRRDPNPPLRRTPIVATFAYKSDLPHFRCSLETVALRQPVEPTGVASTNPQAAESENGIGQMACRLCLDYWGTTTCVVSSRPACTESAEEPVYASWVAPFRDLEMNVDRNPSGCVIRNFLQIPVLRHSVLYLVNIPSKSIAERFLYRTGRRWLQVHDESSRLSIGYSLSPTYYASTGFFCTGRNDRERLSNPYQTHDLCCTDLCPIPIWNHKTT
jgi:hypothetical protein